MKEYAAGVRIAKLAQIKLLHLNTFDGRAKFATWHTRTAINSPLMILRRKCSHPETSMEVMQLVTVSRAASYLSSNDKRAHFGLGSDAAVQTLKNISGDRVLVVNEPSTSEAAK